MLKARLAFNQETMTLDAESNPILGCPFFPRRRSSGESSAGSSSNEDNNHPRLQPPHHLPQVHSTRATLFQGNLLTPGITVSSSSPTPSSSPINGGEFSSLSLSNSNMNVIQRSPTSSIYHHGSRSSSIRRNTSGTRLGTTSPNLGARMSSTGVSRSQSLRTPRSRQQTSEHGSRFRSRISSIPCDMTIPVNANSNATNGNSRASSNQSLPLPADENDYTRLRNFSVTSKGLINRGDSFRTKGRSVSTHSVASNASGQPPSRQMSGTEKDLKLELRVASNFSLGGDGKILNVSASTTPTSGNANVHTEVYQNAIEVQTDNKEDLKPRKSYRVLLLGSQEVGKSAITSQFTTSEYICSYDSSLEEENEKTVEVVLNGEESQMVFVEYPHLDDMQPLLSTYRPDAYVVVYSVTDKRSFQQAKDLLHMIQRVQIDPGEPVRAVILVGNKTDLVRLRAVSTEEGRDVASSHDCKFIETSVGINHHVDELLVGTLAQIRLKHKISEKKRASMKEGKAKGFNKNSSTSGSSCSGCKAKGLIKRILKKACSKSKSCDNLHVL